MKLIYIKRNPFICSQTFWKYGGCVFGPEVAGWAQTEWPPKCDLNNFTFEYYCLQRFNATVFAKMTHYVGIIGI